MSDGRRAALQDYVRGLPKAELHLHLEGTLEPELMFALATRNGVSLPYASVAEAHAAYDFTDLQSFLDLYYAGCAVLVTEQDFFDLTWAYLLHAAADGIRHVEPFFDPQTHTARGVAFDTVAGGIVRALEQGRAELGISWRLIMCFLRDLPAADALGVLQDAEAWTGRITGVGLDSAEVGHPPEEFAAVYARARAAGYRLVAHAGEEGPPAYIEGALDVLGAERIEHGVRCLEDPALTARLARERVPLTVCPLSNVRLRVVRTMADHPLARMIEAGLLVTVNSDDPAYFGGYLVDNYVAAAEVFDLDDATLAALAADSFRASFLDADATAAHIAEVDAYVRTHRLP